MIRLDEQIQSQLGSFGVRLQNLRISRGWSLQDLAERSGLSRAFLSRLESGDRQASIAAVLTLSRIFEVSLASLFETEVEAEPCVIVRRAEAVEQMANGLAYIPLSKADSRFNLQPIRVKVSRSRRGIEHYHHEGEEWIYVLSGSLTLSLAGRTFALEAGDAAHFDSRLPHRLIARGHKDPELLVVASPLSKTPPQRLGLSRELRAIPRAQLVDRPETANRSPQAVSRKQSLREPKQSEN
ncbi:MAG: cupin domain-containing protein [Verrucomicrobia bacterium]|nr:cupin domain-containing protein [Verrucomicrobiota bacterium]